ncbi:restriction endonuclease subunit S [Streptomyces candidus]|uniref:Type I restriction enzyme S subunit n=1 Tax=Streptomyces candidus TaxID=67283 RepID=A0A7X0LQG7_9ACTN|nr:restriction endonuclease subunit S [Streptomyces candidus]MBB6437037.1 type I restriction enzyme S subunit [Streptomyces candidus]GHH32723.1 hypothetical protein GCM10018773_02210 [Streptomyces candidus]
MVNKARLQVPLSSVLVGHFSGAWGDSPSDARVGNVLVLRATNIDGKGGFGSAAPASRIFTDGDLQRKRLIPGDLLVEASGGGPGTPVGRVALFNRNTDGAVYASSNFFRTLRPDPKVIDSEYLTHYLTTVYRSADIWRYQQQTTGLVNLRFSDYLEQPVPLPSLTEQRRIVDAIRTVSNCEGLIEKSIVKLLNIRRGVLDSAFAPAGISEEEGGWRKIPLMAVAHVGGGIALGGVVAGAGGIDVPYLRVANVQDGHISTQEMKTVRVTPVELKRFLLQVGDVLLTEGGDLDKLGRGGVWDGRIKPCLHQNHVFRVRCNELKLIPEFLASYLASTDGRGYFLRNAKQTTNLASVSSSQVKEMPIPCPSIGEQRRVIESLRVCDSQIQLEQEELDKLRILKLGLVDDLLSGRV